MRVLTDHKLMGDEIFDVKACDNGTTDPVRSYQISVGNEIIHTIKFHNEGEKAITGISEEAVMAILLDRLRSRARTYSSREQAVAITKLEESLMWLQRLNRQRILRGEAGSERERQRADPV